MIAYFQSRTGAFIAKDLSEKSSQLYKFGDVTVGTPNHLKSSFYALIQHEYLLQAIQKRKVLETYNTFKAWNINIYDYPIWSINCILINATIFKPFYNTRFCGNDGDIKYFSHTMVKQVEGHSFAIGNAIVAHYMYDSQAHDENGNLIKANIKQRYYDLILQEYQLHKHVLSSKFNLNEHMKKSRSKDHSLREANVRAGHCADAKPIIALKEGHDDGDPSVMLENSTRLLSDEPIVAEQGVIKILILDLLTTSDTNNTLCYHEEVVVYKPKRCELETIDLIASNRTALMGGNGYGIRLTGDALYWSPVDDNRDGSYSATVRVEDPGEYTIEVSLNHRYGCHMMDCDMPESVCPPFEASGSTCAITATPWTSPCVLVVATRQLIVTPRAVPLPPNLSSTLRISSRFNSTSPLSSNSSVRLSPPSSRSSSSSSSKQCDNSGSTIGRWIKPSIAKNESEIFGATTFPYIWQPFNCSLTWINDTDKIMNCFKKFAFVFIGMSRELTHYYDFADFARWNVSSYHKVELDEVFHNLYFHSTSSAYEIDAQTWNHASSGASSGASSSASSGASSSVNSISEGITASYMKLFIQKFSLCSDVRNKKRIKMLITEESMWIARHAYKRNWRRLITTVLGSIKR
jgi:hypothetical protein